MNKRVIVNDDDCVGCGACEAICPEVFKLDDSGKAKVIKPEGGPEDLIEESIEACPVSCIHWEE